MPIISCLFVILFWRCVMIGDILWLKMNWIRPWSSSRTNLESVQGAVITPATWCLLDTVEIPFSAVWSPQLWTNVYSTKWQILGSFHSSSSHSLDVKTYNHGTQHFASTLTDKLFRCTCCNMSCAQRNGRFTWDEISYWLSPSYMVMVVIADQWKWCQIHTYFRGVNLPYFWYHWASHS